MISFFQRTLPLLQDGSQWLEELGPAQSFPQQVLREDREAERQRDKPKERLFVGDEPREDHQDGRGGEEVVPQGPNGHKEGDGIPSHIGGAGEGGDGQGLQLKLNQLGQ